MLVSNTTNNYVNILKKNFITKYRDAYRINVSEMFQNGTFFILLILGWLVNWQKKKQKAHGAPERHILMNGNRSWLKAEIGIFGYNQTQW